MNQKTRNRIIELSILAVVLALVLGVKLFDHYTVNQATLKNQLSETTDGESSPGSSDQTNHDEKGAISEETIIVQIEGEVVNPDVYEVPMNSRVDAVVELAGGFTEVADQSHVNLASKVYDTQKITIYKVGEAPVVLAVNPIGSWTLQDLNEADSERLMEIKGIGESMAGKILDYRNANGPFNDINELLSVSGIGEKKLQTIKEAFESTVKK